MEKSEENLLKDLETFLKTKYYCYQDIVDFFKEQFKIFEKKTFLEMLAKLSENKLIVYIRHAESTYNSWKKEFILNEAPFYKNVPKNWDVQITDLGKKQCEQLIPELEKENFIFDIVFVSPMSRTIQTYNSISNSKCFKNCHNNVYATNLIKEKLHTACDIGTKLNDISNMHKEINFEFIIKEHWWQWWLHDDVERKILKYEKNKHIRKRLFLFLVWILLRKEKNICFVSHQDIYQNLFEFDNFFKKKCPNANFKIFSSKKLIQFITENFKNLN